MMNGLRAKRLAAGLSLRQLSEKSGVAVETLSRLERGRSRPQARTLNKLAVALDAAPEELAKPGAPTTIPKKEDKSVAEQQTISVPAFYPNPQNPEAWKPWDGSEDAWMWKGAMDFRDDAEITAAAYFYRYTKDWSTIPGLLLAAGWRSIGFEEEATEFVEACREEIESRARLL